MYTKKSSILDGSVVQTGSAHDNVLKAGCGSDHILTTGSGSDKKLGSETLLSINNN